MPFEANTLILVAAASAGSAMAYRSLRKLDYPGRTAILFLLAAWAAGLCFGKLIHLINHYISWRQYYESFGHGISGSLSQGFLPFLFYGYSSAGGMLGAALGAFLFCRMTKHPLEATLDACVLPFLLMYGMSRIGCALYGCCYGIEITAPDSALLQSLLASAQGCRLFPVQWLDVCLTAIVFAAISFKAARQRAPGLRLRLFLLLYPLQRFLLEFLRGDGERGMIWLLSTAQWIFLLAFCAGIALHIKKTSRI